MNRILAGLRIEKQGAAATGYGGGGEGAKSTANDTTNYAGGAGSPGAIRLIHHILR